MSGVELTAEQRAALEREAAGVANGASPAAGSSWVPLAADALQELVAGGQLGEPPVMLARTDGVRLLYAGRAHAFSGEPEACKGWLALAATAELLEHEPVLYIDLEDTAATQVSRLLALGVPGDAIRDRFLYVRPDEPLEERGWEALASALAARPALAIVDGVTEALALQGLDLRDNGDVARWLALLPRRLLAAGPAVLLLDHVVKDREQRGRYALGAQHKLAGIDVAYTLEVIEPFGRGREGLVKVVVAKDRPGFVRQHAERGDRIADLRLSATADDGAVAIELVPPVAGRSTFRPTVLMECACRAVEESPGLTVRAIRGAVGGKHDALTLALELLVGEGFLRVEKGPRNAQQHYPARPFRTADEAADE